MTTTETTRRDNLRTVYLFVVDNWAVDRADIARHLTQYTKEQISSLLDSLRRKGLVVGEQVNGEGMLVWQSYYDVQNGDPREDAEAEFDAKYPDNVADAKSPKASIKHAPDAGMVVYEVAKTRLTGAWTTLTFNGKDHDKVGIPTRWTCTCNTHGTVHNVKARMTGEALCHHPEDWCADCQVIDTTNQHEQVANDLNPRYTVQEVSVGSAGLTARPAVIDTVDGTTVKVFQGKNGRTNAEKHAAKLNKAI